MPTKFPLLRLSVALCWPPLPKFAGPLNTLYTSTDPSPEGGGPVLILPKLGTSVVIKNEPGPKEASPVKLMAPLPFATTSDPTCCSVTV